MQLHRMCLLLVAVACDRASEPVPDSADTGAEEQVQEDRSGDGEFEGEPKLTPTLQITADAAQVKGESCDLRVPLTGPAN